MNTDNIHPALSAAIAPHVELARGNAAEMREDWSAHRVSRQYGCYGWEIRRSETFANLSYVQRPEIVCSINSDDEHDRADAQKLAACPALLRVAEMVLRMEASTERSGMLDISANDLTAIYKAARAALATIAPENALAGLL